MNATTELFQSLKDKASLGPRMLTKREIELLKQDRKESAAYFREAFKDIKGTLAPKK